MPNLIEVQRVLMIIFSRWGSNDERQDVGLQEVFKTVFPIKDFSEISMLEFVRYELETPKFDVDECQQRGLTFALLLR